MVKRVFGILFLLFVTILFCYQRQTHAEDAKGAKDVGQKIREAKKKDANYGLLRPFHIQQDRKDSCSLATSLMVINLFRDHFGDGTRGGDGEGHYKKLTQEEFRRWLTLQGGILKEWSLRVNGDGVGVGVRDLTKFLEKTFSVMFFQKLNYKKIKITHYYQAKVTSEIFKSILEKGFQSPYSLVLLDYGAHWSPRGWYDKKTQMVGILDVDYAEEYSSIESVYSINEGEVIYNANELFNGHKALTGFILIELIE